MKKFIFWLIQLTWGIITNIIGLLISTVLILTGNKPNKFHQTIYFEIGKNWGGFNMGFCTVVSKNPSKDLLQHEHGHFIQNFYFGPFMIFIQIASASRYWIRRWQRKKGKTLKPYDSIWFEGQATKLGEKLVK